eukprot:gene15912-18869_t
MVAVVAVVGMEEEVVVDMVEEVVDTAVEVVDTAVEVVVAMVIAVGVTAEIVEVGVMVEIAEEVDTAEIVEEVDTAEIAEEVDMVEVIAEVVDTAEVIAEEVDMEETVVVDMEETVVDTGEVVVDTEEAVIVEVVAMAVEGAMVAEVVTEVITHPLVKLKIFTLFDFGSKPADNGLTEEDINGLVEQRDKAKKCRNFEEADSLRDQLEQAGVRVENDNSWTCRDGRRGKMVSGASRGDKVIGDGQLSWENTIYFSGLPSNVTVSTLVDFFGSIGPIKKSKKRNNQGEPVVHLYKNKATGQNKGDGTISYEDPDTAKAAVEWFNNQEFTPGGQPSGYTMGVSIATRPDQSKFQ